MKHTVLFFVFLITWGLFFTHPATASERAASTAVVATVNGAAITEKEFNLNVDFFKQRMAMQGQEITNDQESQIKEKILDNMIDAELLYQAAVKEKTQIDEAAFEAQWSRVEKRMKEDDEYKKNIEKMNLSPEEMRRQIRRQMMIQKFVSEKFMAPTTVSEEEITAYYESNRNKFHSPEQVKASHILIKVDNDADEKENAAARKKIEDIEKEIKSGADFGDMAEKHSDCPSKSSGGDLGYFSRGKMVKPFEDAAFGLKEGEISDIVTTTFGYHLIKVTGKKPESTVSREDAGARIESYLKQQKAQQKVASFLAEQKKEADITRQDT